MTAPILTDDEVRQWIRQNVPITDVADKRILLIVPDATRTAPLPLLWDALFQHLKPHVVVLDVLIALGTHKPMSEVQISKLLGIKDIERQRLFFQTQFFNHEWDNPDALMTLGTLSEADTAKASNGLLSKVVPVQINKLVENYDQLMVLGPVFPHEVVGFSGGNKYFFPGISGPDLLNFFHWLGALITNVGIIGVKSTPVRDVVNMAANMIQQEKRALTFVVTSDGTARLHGLFYNTPEQAWSDAADLSGTVHIKRMDKPFQTVLSCAPKMYDELWTGGKCIYKLEPVLADGGELIIYAPHITEVCVAHGKTLHEVGYHCRDYFVKQWDKFKHYPWGVLAHSCHVYGLGSYENGKETPRARVTLATGIPPDVCRRINLGYCDPKSINPMDYANREQEGVLLVPKAGEMLYHLKNPPKWAGGA